MKDIIVVVGLGFGDEGKGTMTDYFTRKYNVKTVVRFNGGPQAAHYVVTPYGFTHCFSQFGSGTLAEANTYLSRFMFIEPYALEVEASAIRKIGVPYPWRNLYVSRRCCIVTPYHKLIGQMVELSKGKSKHGSVGLGVGQAVFDAERLGSFALMIGDILVKSTMEDKLAQLHNETYDRAEVFVNADPSNEWLMERFNDIRRLQPTRIAHDYKAFSNILNQVDAEYLRDIIYSNDSLIFEGAQGALIGFEGGFRPYISKSNTTTLNANELLESYQFLTNVQRVGVLRAYDHRHGPGPFPTEDPEMREKMVEIHNGENSWQGPFRVGWFDMVMTRYALGLNFRLSSLALTNIDKMSCLGEIKVCTHYTYGGKESHLLDQFFRFERFRGEHVIRHIRCEDRTPEQLEILTRLLFDCKPEYVIYDGWEEDISKVTSYVDFPHNLRMYVNALQNDLNVPISVISKGDTWEDKVEVKI